MQSEFPFTYNAYYCVNLNFAFSGLLFIFIIVAAWCLTISKTPSTLHTNSNDINRDTQELKLKLVYYYRLFPNLSVFLRTSNRWEFLNYLLLSSSHSPSIRYFNEKQRKEIKTLLSDLSASARRFSRVLCVRV